MITAVLTASGFSKRMGLEKLLLPIGGIPMIRRIAMTIRQSNADELILVYRNPEVRKVTEDLVHKAVQNKQTKLGQSEAVKLGVRCANPLSSAFLFVMGDQPLLTAETINQIITIHKRHLSRIIRPFHMNQPGNPVLFPADYKQQMLKLLGDEGGITIMRTNRQVILECHFDNPEVVLDADTWLEYQELIRILESEKR